MNYLTIGTLWYLEDTYAKDFISYHRAVGVEKFVIFDREYHKLNELIGNEPDVEIIHFPQTPENTHQEAFGQLIKYNQGKTKWLALIDADQCLVPVKTTDVKEILKNYEEFASLQLNWKTFGSSHQEKRLPGSIYNRFLLSAENSSSYNFPTQFICQPDRTLGVKLKEPHYPLLPDGEISVNTNKEEIDKNKIVAMNPNTPCSFNIPVLDDIMYVNHYTNKSKEEWIIKNNKGRADIFGAKIPFEQFDQYEKECNQVENTRALEIWIGHLFMASLLETV